MEQSQENQLTPGQGLPAPHGSPREALFHSPPGSFYIQDGILSCAACDCEAESYQCECENGFGGHDCGEDCCCCAYPEENVRCEACYGRGVQHYCENRDCAEHELWNRVDLENLTEENASDQATASAGRGLHDRRATSRCLHPAGSHSVLHDSAKDF